MSNGLCVRGLNVVRNSYFNDMVECVNTFLLIIKCEQINHTNTRADGTQKVQRKKSDKK